MTIQRPELDEQLRALGDELDRRSRAHTHVPLDNPKRSRGPMLIAAGLVAVTVSGLALIASIRTDTDTVAPPATEPPATAASTTPSIAPAAYPGTQACVDSLERFVNSDMPADVLERVDWPNVAEAQVITLDVPNEPSQVRVLIVDDNAGYTCKFDRDAPATTTVNGDLVASAPGPIAQRPDPDQVHLIDAPGTSINLGVGPGTTLYVGRIGDAVVDIAAVLPNGDRQPGVINDGWFVIDVDVPSGVELHSGDQIAWSTSTSGEEIARVDLLDAVTPAEQCASEPGCVQRRIDELIAAAQNDPAQAATLSDRIVTNDERRTHQQAFIDCLVAKGIDAEITPNGRGHVITQESTDTAPNADAVDTLAAQRQCAAAHTDYIAEAYDLLDADTRINGQ